MERMDDTEVIRRAQAGDRHAFGVLFDTYYPTVYRYLHDRLGGAPEAEDLCQEVFLTVLGSIDEYPCGGKLGFDEWLLHVARRLASEYFSNRNRNRQRRQPQERIEPEAVPPRLNPVAVDLLSEQQRQVAIYRFRAGLSVRQTAAALGMDAAMIRRIQRAALETWLQFALSAGDAPDHG